MLYLCLINNLITGITTVAKITFLPPNFTAACYFTCIEWVKQTQTAILRKTFLTSGGEVTDFGKWF